MFGKFLNVKTANKKNRKCAKLLRSKFKNLVNRTAPVVSDIYVPKFETDSIKIEGLVQFLVNSIWNLSWSTILAKQAYFTSFFLVIVRIF